MFVRMSLGPLSLLFPHPDSWYRVLYCYHDTVVPWGHVISITCHMTCTVWYPQCLKKETANFLDKLNVDKAIIRTCYLWCAGLWRHVVKRSSQWENKGMEVGVCTGEEEPLCPLDNFDDNDYIHVDPVLYYTCYLRHVKSDRWKWRNERRRGIRQVHSDAQHNPVKHTCT